MKTTEKQRIGLENAYKNAGHNAFFGNGFNAGVEWGRANPIEPLVRKEIAERPKIENFFHKGSSLIDVQKEYAKSNVMYLYMTALDRYIDELYSSFTT